MSLKYEPCSLPPEASSDLSNLPGFRIWGPGTPRPSLLNLLVYLVIYDSGQVSLEHPLFSRYPSQSGVCSRVSARAVSPTLQDFSGVLLNTSRIGIAPELLHACVAAKSQNSRGRVRLGLGFRGFRVQTLNPEPGTQNS